MTHKQSLAEKIAQSIIANNVALFYNEEITRTRLYSRELKHKINPLVKLLLKKEVKNYELIFGENDKVGDILQNYYIDMINEIASLGIHCSDEVRAIIQAYKLDPDSIKGITKKILRNKK